MIWAQINFGKYLIYFVLSFLLFICFNLNSSLNKETKRTSNYIYAKLKMSKLKELILLCVITELNQCFRRILLVSKCELARPKKFFKASLVRKFHILAHGCYLRKRSHLWVSIKSLGKSKKHKCIYLRARICRLLIKIEVWFVKKKKNHFSD